MSQAGKLTEGGKGEARGKLMTVCIQKEQKDNTTARIWKGIWQVRFYPKTIVCMVKHGETAVQTAMTLEEEIFFFFFLLTDGMKFN